MIQVVIINGKPRTGKDTVVEICKDFFDGSKVQVHNLSTVDCVRKIMKIFEIEEIKTSKLRGQMSDCKDYLTSTCDLPTLDIMQTINRLNADEHHLVFVHAREPENIKTMRSVILQQAALGVKIAVQTLLIKRDTENVEYAKATNHADTNVDAYKYDIIMYNDDTLEKLRSSVADVICKMLPNL